MLIDSQTFRALFSLPCVLRILAGINYGTFCVCHERKLVNYLFLYTEIVLSPKLQLTDIYWIRVKNQSIKHKIKVRPQRASKFDHLELMFPEKIFEIFML